MKKLALTTLAAAALASAASSASAGFFFTISEGTLGDSRKYVDVTLVNDGGETGTRIVAYQLTYSGTPISFNFGDFDADATTPNTVDIANSESPAMTNGLSAFRLGSAGQTSLVFSNPPDTSSLWSAPIGEFEVVITHLSSNQPSNSTRIARFVYPTNSSPAFRLSGVTAGDIGPTMVPVSITVPIPEPTILAMAAAGTALLLRRRK